MDKQFTASEVREESTKVFGDHSVSGLETRARRRAMLNAYADLLEAQEKAVPVAWCDPATINNMHPTCYKKLEYRSIADSVAGVKFIPLYAHQAPADVEMLAEALRVAREWLRGERNSTIDKHNPWEALMRGIDAALTAHSAQAQLPAAMPEQTHYVAEVIDDCRRRALDLEWDMKNKWPEWSQDEAVLGIICVAQNLQASLGSLGATMKAQPPAASVTDAMVNAAMRADFCGHNVADALMCGTDWTTEVMRAALEAALAVQENPNG